MKAWLSIGLFLLVFSVPGTIEAQQLVPVACNTPAGCGTCEFVDLINNVIQFIVTISSILAAIVVVYAGFRLVTAAGDVSAMTKAKSLMINVLIGYVLVLGAFLIINTILAAILPGDSPILNWQQIECVYPSDVTFDPDAYIGPGFNTIGGPFVGSTNTIPTRGGGGGGSCSVMSSGACAPSNLSCFGDTEAASKVCNLESSGGNTAAMSGSDLCRDNRSFSGGLFQINILANNRFIPGCSNDFYTKNGSSAQGNCLRPRTNSNGVSYCAMWDCAMTDIPMYNHCVTQTLNPQINLDIACSLFSNGGWSHWRTSARACGVI